MLQRVDFVLVCEPVGCDPAHVPFVPAVRGATHAEGPHPLLGVITEVRGRRLYVSEPSCHEEPAEFATAVVVDVALRLPDLQPQLVETAQQRFVRAVEDQSPLLDRRCADHTARPHHATDLGEGRNGFVERLQHREQRARVEGRIGEVELVDAALEERHVLDVVFGHVRPSIRELSVVEIDTGHVPRNLSEADRDRAGSAPHIDDPVSGVRDSKVKARPLPSTERSPCAELLEGRWTS